MAAAVIGPPKLDDGSQPETVDQMSAGRYAAVAVLGVSKLSAR